MAYLDRDFAVYQAAPGLPMNVSGLGSAAPSPGLSPLERSVVRLSLRDARSTLSASPRWLAGIRGLLGFASPNALADPRLEALRRFAVLTRLDGVAAGEEQARFLAAGFDPVQADQVAAMVAGAARRRRRDGIGAAGWVVSLGAAGGMFAAAVGYVGDPLVGVVASALGFVTIAPFAARGAR